MTHHVVYPAYSYAMTHLWSSLLDACQTNVQKTFRNLVVYMENLQYCLFL